MNARSTERKGNPNLRGARLRALWDVSPVEAPQPRGSLVLGADQAVAASALAVLDDKHRHRGGGDELRSDALQEQSPGAARARGKREAPEEVNGDPGRG